jgi:hypothetical protein
MALECDLGTLIRMLNPYTNGGPGTMQIAPGVAEMPPPGIDPAVLDQLHLEVDDYTGHWSFKGHDQRIRRALRIRYRYPADGAAGMAGVFQTEYLLIGFAGADGGG